MTVSPLSDFKTIVLDPLHPMDQKSLHQDIINHVMTTYRAYKDDRQDIEKIWDQSWASYLGTRQAQQHIDNQSLKIIGSVKTNWRHKTQVGKAFETVETLHAYFMQAFFPNQNWFDLEAKLLGYDALAKVLKFYMQNKFDEWNFREEWSAFLRQLIICGTSVMALPWSHDDNKVEYETLNLAETYFNPRARRIEDTAFIRTVIKTRAELIEGINRGTYSKSVTPKDVIGMHASPSFGEIDYDKTGQRYKEFLGVEVREYSFIDKLTTLEYWGDIDLPYLHIKNALVHIGYGNVLRFQPINYKNSRGESYKPFIIGSYIPVVRQSYGLGALQSSLSMLTQMNNSANQMLDGVELAVNPMYTYIQDQTVDPENLETEPGKLIPVETHDAIRPVAPPPNNFGLSFQQLGYLEQMINQNVGLGPLLGVGQPRGGERVTAAEIQAVIEAGGNRQLGVYTHIQTNSLIPLLRKTIWGVKQFTTVDNAVRVDDKLNGVSYLVDVGPQELDFDFDIKPKGSEHVIQKEEFAARRSQILSLALQLPPEIQQQLDLTQIFLDVVQATLYEDPDKYLIQQAPEPEAPSIEEAGTPTQQAFLQEQLLADGGASIFNRLFNEQLPEGLLENGNANTTGTSVEPTASN